MKNYFDIENKNLINGIIITMRVSKFKPAELKFELSNSYEKRKSCEQESANYVKRNLPNGVKLVYEIGVPEAMTESELEYAMDSLSKQYQSFQFQPDSSYEPH